jgi:hypothetical protein
VNTTLYAQWNPIQRSVTYNGNGNTGGEVPTDSNSPYQNGATVTVLGNTGNLVKTDSALNSFVGWNTAANGSGTSYTAGNTFTISANTTLYAQWVWDIPPTATPLSANTWVEGSIADVAEQWFKFTATATKNYIHLNFTGLGYAGVQLFTDSGVAIGNFQNLNSGLGIPSSDRVGSFSREIEIGQEYYICVSHYYESSYDTGSYRIALTETSESPNLITLPDGGIVFLTANTWAEGETGSSDQWYSFTANANTQYIHILPGTGIAFNIQVYGSNGGTVGNLVYSTGGNVVGPWELETSKTYYIRFLNLYNGTFKVAFNDSTTPPPIALPTEGVIQLTANIWVDGTTSGGEWYKLTANAVTQYIHFNFTTATGARVNVYDSIGNMFGTQNNAQVYTPSFSRELTNGSVYYLHVTDGLYDGAFQIAFNASETPPAITLPSENVIELSANTWTNGSTAYNGKQWFCFTANVSPQYVHLSGISTGISLRLYDSSGNGIGNPVRIRASSNDKFLSQTVTSGQMYYVKAEGIGSDENNYKISFNGSETPPALE